MQRRVHPRRRSISRRHRQLCEPLEQRTLLNGLTIIAHGAELFSGLGSSARPGWITDMGNAIARRLGGNTPVYTIRIEPGSGGIGGLKVAGFTRLSGAANLAGSTSGQAILLLDWAAASNVDLFKLSSSYSATTVAQLVVPFLTTAYPAAGLTAPLAEGAIQLIGHSRGGSVISELARSLGQSGLWVDQVTTLDPRPVSPDPSVSLKSNVIFADNYYQNSGDGLFTPNGQSITGAANFGPLSVSGGYGSTHSNIPLFYQGTIDSASNASLEGHSVPNAWYAGNNISRTTGGFYYSSMGGGATARPVKGLGANFGGTGARGTAARAGAQWANIGTLVPSTGQLGAGQAFATSFRYNSFNTPATVQWFLDVDNNPYNNNSIALGAAQGLAATGESVVKTTASLAVGNVAFGTYYLVGRISNTAGTRYAYSSAVSVSNLAPIGTIDVAGPVALQGWVVDPDATATALSIRVDVDGTPFHTTTANIARTDLVKSFGSANHGYTVDLSALSTGMHRVDLYALDASTGNPTLIGTRTINTNQAPLGSIDWFDGHGLAGWAYDPNVPATSIQVRYSIDNHAPVFLPTNQDRADVGAAFGINNTHGYAVILPQLTAGSHTVAVFAVDPLTQALTPLGTRTVTVANPPGNALPRGNLDAATTTLVAGWAYDPTHPTAAASMRIDIDGVGGTPFLANLSRSDLANLPGGAGAAHAFSQTLTLTPGQHRIDLFILDTTDGTPVLLSSRIVGATVPLGSIDVAAAGQVSGWAYSAAQAAAGTSVAVFRVDFDSITGPARYTDTARGDIDALFTPGMWGYSIAMPYLPSGAHTASLYVLDPLTLSATLIVTRNFTV